MFLVPGNNDLLFQCSSAYKELFKRIFKMEQQILSILWAFEVDRIMLYPWHLQRQNIKILVVHREKKATSPIKGKKVKYFVSKHIGNLFPQCANCGDDKRTIKGPYILWCANKATQLLLPTVRQILTILVRCAMCLMHL